MLVTKGTGVIRRRHLDRRGVLGAIDHDPVQRQALEVNGPDTQTNRAIFVRPIEPGLCLGVAGDRGVGHQAHVVVGVHRHTQALRYQSKMEGEPL